jgi:hypothetical protein
MRRRTYIAAIIILSVLTFVTSCGGDDSINLVFNQVQGGCAAINESIATIQCDDGLLTFEGSAVTPNPCYYLKANPDITDRSNAVIVITAESGLIDGSYCAECLGEMSFDGTLELSGVCSKIVSIVYNGATIAVYERQ